MVSGKRMRWTAEGSRRKLLWRDHTQAFYLREVPFVESDDDIQIQNYRHLLAGAFRIFRASHKSRCHARASFSGKSVSARAAANSLPVQSFARFGVGQTAGSTLLIFNFFMSLIIQFCHTF